MRQGAPQLVQPQGRVRQVSRRLPRGEGAEHAGPALPLARLRAGGQGAGQLRRRGVSADVPLLPSEPLAAPDERLLATFDEIEKQQVDITSA